MENSVKEPRLEIDENGNILCPHCKLNFVIVDNETAEANGLFCLDCFRAAANRS